MDSYLCSGNELLPHIIDAEVSTDDRPTIDFLALAQLEGLLPQFVGFGGRDDGGDNVWSIKPRLGVRREPPFVGEPGPAGPAEIGSDLQGSR